MASKELVFLGMVKAQGMGDQAQGQGCIWGRERAVSVLHIGERGARPCWECTACLLLNSDTRLSSGIRGCKWSLTLDLHLRLPTTLYIFRS